MGSLDGAEVLHIAKLARIELNEKELGKFSTQLTAILNYVDKLKCLDIKDTTPLVHSGELQNVIREDNPSPSLNKDDALRNAPNKNDNFFEVYKVIE